MEMEFEIKRLADGWQFEIRDESGYSLHKRTSLDKVFNSIKFVVFRAKFSKHFKVTVEDISLTQAHKDYEEKERKNGS